MGNRLRLPVSGAVSTIGVGTAAHADSPVSGASGGGLGRGRSAILPAIMTTAFDPNSAAMFDGIFGLPHGAEDARVVLLPVPFDATTSYREGTEQGPSAIREASLQVDLHDADTGEPWKQGIWMAPEPEELRALNLRARALAAPVKADGGAGDHPDALEAVNEAGEKICAWVREQTAVHLDRGKIVGIIGGDHASPLGAILALAERHPGMGVLHIDAHADLRVAYEGFVHSHASIMHNALARTPAISRLVQVAIRDLCEQEAEAIRASAGRIRSFHDAEIARAMFRGETFASVVERILAELPRDVYVSFDIDGLDPSLCPNTGTPVPGGLSFQQACYLLEALATSGHRIVGFDLCEVCPGANGETIDAIVGARILYKLIGWTLVSQDCASPSPDSPDSLRTGLE